MLGGGGSREPGCNEDWQASDRCLKEGDCLDISAYTVDIGGYGAIPCTWIGKGPGRQEMDFGNIV